LVGSLLLLATIGFKKWVLGEVTQENPHIIWMAPLSLLIVIVPVAGVLALARRASSRYLTTQVIVWILSFLVLLNFALYFTRLGKLAVVLLAAGVATQAARMLTRRLAGFATFNRRAIPVGFLLLVIASLSLGGWFKWKESRLTAQLPPASDGAPNVILLILDTVRAASLSLYGHSRPTTPVLDSLAPNAIVFDRAIAPAPWTLPSHASMMTGLWPHEHGATWRKPLRDVHPTLAEVLTRRGYRTGAAVANLTFTSREYGISRGFTWYRDFKVTWDEILVNAPLTATIINRPELRQLFGWSDAFGRKLAPVVTRQFLEFIDQDTSRPYFAFLNYMDAHDPYLPPPPFDSLFGPVDVRRNEKMRFWQRSGGRMNKERLPADQVEGMLAAYEGSIAMLDREIGRLLDSLRARNRLENTILIVSSDHGEFFGEHGLFEHAKAPYLEVIHVPLLIWAPGRISGGVRYDDPVSLRRIPTTVMSLIDWDADGKFPAPSLLPDSLVDLPDEPVISQLDRDTKGAQEDRGVNTVAAETMLSLVDGSYHYLRLGQRGQRLFDHVKDPSEQHDLSKDRSYARHLERLRARLDSALDTTSTQH
jgi:arylsulfatase A-like enzyme